LRTIAPLLVGLPFRLCTIRYFSVVDFFLL
jgi:hypothetical protein